MIHALPQLERLKLAGGLLDAKGTIRALNHPCQRLLALTDAETEALIGQPFATLFETMSAPLANEVLQFASDGHWHGDLFFQDASGGWHPVYLIVSRLDNSRHDAEAPPIYLFIALDYTEQHYALNDLLRRQALLQKMWRDFPIGVIAVDGEGAILQVNGAAKALWEKLDATVAVGDSHDALFAPIHEDLREAYDEALITRQSRKLTDVPLAGPDGPLVHFEVIPQPRQGPLQFVLMFIENRTEAILLEARLRETERFASLGFMAANIAHEINNPLQSLQGALELLQSRCGQLDIESDKRAGLDKASQLCLSDVARIAKIIEPILNLARNRTPELVQQPVQALLEKVIEGVQHIPRLKLINFLANAPNAGEIETDPGLVQQFLTNLIVNAGHAMDGQGDIALLAFPDRQDPGKIHILVRDHGPGIDAKNARHLFTPFFTTKPPGEGTGLGLYTSRAMAAQLGGWLDLMTSDADGATFDLTLPRTFTAADTSDNRAWIPHSR